MQPAGPTRPWTSPISKKTRISSSTSLTFTDYYNTNTCLGLVLRLKIRHNGYSSHNFHDVRREFPFLPQILKLYMDLPFPTCTCAWHCFVLNAFIMVASMIQSSYKTKGTKRIGKFCPMDLDTKSGPSISNRTLRIKMGTRLQQSFILRSLHVGQEELESIMSCSTVSDLREIGEWWSICVPARALTRKCSRRIFVIGLQMSSRSRSSSSLIFDMLASQCVCVGVFFICRIFWRRNLPYITEDYDECLT